MSARVMEIVRAHVETVEQLGLDEAYLDLSGHVAPRAAMRRLIADICSHCGLHCSVGIGPNRLVAKVASDAEKPRGFVVLTREQACTRFAGASPGLVPGIGPKTVERLDRLGIRSLGGLAQAPEADLIAAFGTNHGPDLRRRARFEGASTVTPVRVAVSESREQTFDTDVADPAKQEELMRGLAAELCARVRRAGSRGRTIAIKVRLDDFTTVTRARTLSLATDDASVVADVAAELLRDYAPPRPVRLLGVRLAGLDHEPDDSPQLVLPL
jgi:DNA polymerase-4